MFPGLRSRPTGRPRCGGPGGHCRGPALRTGPTLLLFSLGCFSGGAGVLRSVSCQCSGGRRREGGGPPERVAALTSPAQAEPLDQRAVARDVGALQVLQEPAALAHQDEQTTTAVVVVLVLLEVLRQVPDARREHRDLDLGRARVPLARRVLGHDLLLGGGVG